MVLKGIVDEDFTNYKKPSLVLIFPTCTFKCDLDCGKKLCQNSSLVKSSSVDFSIEYILKKYTANPITKALVCGGLEPFDSWEQLLEFICAARDITNDDIIIYTGYNYEEIMDKVQWLKKYTNIIIKFGRYLPNQSTHYDKVLGVNLASSNQYAMRL